MLDIYIIFANGKVVYVEKKWVNIIIYSILKLNGIIIFVPKVLAQIKTLFIAGQLILHSELHEFVNYHSSKQVHKDLQVSRINRDLDDVQGVFDLLNESLINPVERKELVSLSSGVFPGNQIVAYLDQAYEKGKKCMETSLMID